MKRSGIPLPEKYIFFELDFSSANSKLGDSLTLAGLVDTMLLIYSDYASKYSSHRH
jgi:hypothetical protein